MSQTKGETREEFLDRVSLREEGAAVRSDSESLKNIICSVIKLRSIN